MNFLHRGEALGPALRGSPAMPVLDLPTPHGPARVHLADDARARVVLMLGHGAGGGVGAPDLQAAAAAARRAGVAVALVEQPYRVAGRRSPAPAAQLDGAWTAVAEQLLAGAFAGRALLAGGRSSGARVACRTAPATGAIGVLCLAFPLVPPARRGGEPGASRLPELDAAGVPMLVVQGERDRFGMPPPGPGRTVVAVRSDHALKADLPALSAAVTAWLESLKGRLPVQ